MLRFLTRAPAALGALMLIVTFTPLDLWWMQRLSGPWDGSRGGILIVLSAEAADDGMIGEHSYWRCVYASHAWKEGRFPVILISGDALATPAMRQFLIAAGVPADAIRLETRSGSTRESALHTAEMLRDGKEPLTLLSSDLHMRRALAAFRKAGLTVRSEPMPDAGKHYATYLSRWPAFLDLCDETVKLAWYKARGWA